jgi:hypothetical protein
VTSNNDRVVERNWDHAFPKSWYPDVTPKDLAKWQVPSCIPCNSKYGRIESDFLSRVGLSLEPHHPASRNVVETAMRSMKATAGRDERDRELRHARGTRILAETLQGAAIPQGATIPGMGERWGRPVEDQIAVLLPAPSLRLMTEKVVRGIFYVQDGVFIEPPYKIDFYLLPDDAAAIWSVTLDTYGVVYSRPPGLVVRRAIEGEDERRSLFEITFWQQFKTYAAVTMNEKRAVKAKGPKPLKAKPLKLKSAWVVTWFGSNTHNKPPLAILDYRLSARSVRDIVQMLYAVERYTPEEQLRYVKSPKDNPYPAVMTQFQRITCGHNPLLFARQVSDLHMEGDGLKWTEPPPESKLRRKLTDAGILR